MFQINREMGKAKGKVVTYDLAALPRGKNVKDVLHDMADDGVYFYNSAQEGNATGKNIDVGQHVKEIDLGVSRTIEILIPLKMQLQDMADRLTGIPDERMGQIAPQSTVTNAQSNIAASRTITEPMFYFMDRFTERVFSRILEAIKVSWGVMASSEADMIVGDAAKGFFKATSNIANDDYGATLIDGREEAMIRSTLDHLAEVSINAKELRLKDWLKGRMSETLGEYEEVLTKGWDEVEAMRLKNAQIRAESVDKKTEAQYQIALEDREDRQAHSKEMLILQKGLEGMQQAQKDKGRVVADTNKAEQAREKTPMGR